MTQPLPNLYSFRRCPYAIRARMALLVSGTACHIREISLRSKPEEMITASPKATVPVLILPGGEVIDESIDIMRWALAHNDPENWLAGDDIALIAANDGPFKFHLDRYKYPHKYDCDPLPHRAASFAILSAYESRLTAHPNLCRDTPSLTDYAILPFVRQFAATDLGWFGEQALPRLQVWLAQHLGSLLFERAMAKHARWQAGDAPVLLATRTRDD